MKWKIELNEEFGFIHSVYKGTFTNQEIKEAIVEAMVLTQGDGPHLFLTDVREAESLLSVLNLYEIPSFWELLGANKSDKLAIVGQKGGILWEDLKFYENVCYNRGWQVKLFQRWQEAIDWLTDHHPSLTAGNNG